MVTLRSWFRRSGGIGTCSEREKPVSTTWFSANIKVPRARALQKPYFAPQDI
jgi:hypothetical protein